MATRIGTFGANQVFLNQIFTVQDRVNTEQQQVTTGLVSTNYSGISAQADAVLTMQTQAVASQQYITDNTQLTTTLDTATTAVDSIYSTVQQFTNALTTFSEGATKNTENIASIQSQAFNAMTDLASYLSVNVGGQYLFSGGRTSTPPVNLPASSLSEFQSLYNGASNAYPTTRTANLASINLNTSVTGALTFNPDAGTVTAATANSLKSIPVGSRITIGGGLVPTTPVTVTSNNGTTLGISQLTSETANGATITLPSATSLPATFGNLTFTTGSNVINAASAPGVAELTAGASFTVTGTAHNNGTFTVVANDGSGNITVSSASGQSLVSETAASAGLSLAAGSAVPSSAFGNLTFTPGSDTITASTPNGVAALAAGTMFTISGSSNNNGTYQVLSNDGAGKITLASTKLDFVSATTSETAATLTDLNATPVAAVGTAGYGALTIGVNSGNQITMSASTQNAFAGGFNVGDTIQVGNATDSVNNGLYYVSNNDGTNLTLSRAQATGIIPTTSETAALVTDTNSSTTVATGAYGKLSIDATSPNNVTMSSSTVGAFPTASFAPGDTITVAGATDSENTGTFTIVSNDGTNMKLTRSPAVTNTFTTTGTSAPTLTAPSWYQGDTLSISQQIDQGRTLSVGIYASDPAFEKAIRAMGIIAQGVTGTPGGLDQNQGRIKAALYLLNSSLQSPAPGTPPYGSEMSSDLPTLQAKIGYDNATVKTKSDAETQFVGFLQTRLATVIEKDPSAAITDLLADTHTLQASYQALGQIWNLSLLNYLK